MSTGQWAGAASGAVIGFIYGGGVYGAIVGAAIGFAVGSAIDPVVPDLSSLGQSAIGELDVTLANEGVVVADALGTVKCVGNIFWYGGSRVIELKEEVSGGKGGGGQEVVTGHEYHLSWAVGLLLGPADELISIFKDNDPCWQGNELRSNSVNGMTTITIQGTGTVYFYFGTSDHVANTFMGDLIYSETGQTYNPPYKNLCYAYFKDCSIGDYNRAPTFKFVIRKSPEYSFSIVNRIGGYDYNPAHAIYYLLLRCTEIPEAMIDTDSFSTAADTLTLEGRGVSIYFGQEGELISYLESILTHISAIVQYENDGKFHLDLIRPDVDEADMPSFSDEDFVETPQITRNTWSETKNEIKIQYSKRVDVEFEEEVDPVKNPDVYVMGFIDEAHNTACQEDWSDYETNWLSRGYCQVDGTSNWHNTLTYGPACAKLLYDLDLYYTSPGVPKEKTWLLSGSFHVSALNRIYLTSVGFWQPILPDNYVPASYCDYFNEYAFISAWSTDLSLWQAQFQIMISLGRGEFIPGSVLRVYIDTSSLGGISALEPAYSQFKDWVTATYGGIVYLEHENISEHWIQQLHEDLTPYGYGG